MGDKYTQDHDGKKLTLENNFYYVLKIVDLSTSSSMSQNTGNADLEHQLRKYLQSDILISRLTYVFHRYSLSQPITRLLFFVQTQLRAIGLKLFLRPVCVG